MNKQELRERMKKKRSALKADWVAEKSGIICERFAETEIYKKAGFIAVYMSIKNEVDLKKLIERAFSDKKRVCVPVTDSKTEEIYLAEIFADDAFSEGDFGISEPEKKRRIDIKAVDLVLIPGLGFDFYGGRVGWGKGFYDRLLEGSAADLVGIGYEFQLCGEVETEAHDRKMDYILTESELVVCG